MDTFYCAAKGYIKLAPLSYCEIDKYNCYIIILSFPGCMETVEMRL